jgi:hypothetical protein
MVADLLKANAGSFDVAIACELMYFRTDVFSLMQTVLELTGNGLFLHAHLFRRYGQEVRMFSPRSLEYLLISRF